MAGILQTGGIIDVLIRLLRDYQRTISPLEQLPLTSFLQTTSRVLHSGGTWFAQGIIGLKLLQVVFLGILFGLTVLGLSILCQAVLVYTVGVRGRFTRPTLQEGFAVARERFWSVAMLTLVPILAYACGWFVFLAPFGSIISLGSVWALIAYVVATLLALLLGFAATALHLLALQRVVLDGTPAEQALREAWALLRQSWFVILETACGMFVMGIALFLAGVVAFTIFLLPVLALVGVAIVFQAATATNLLLLLSEFLFILAMLGMGGFMITFQYTVWNRLYTRLAKGMAVAKVVRVVHATLGRLHDLRTGS